MKPLIRLHSEKTSQSETKRLIKLTEGHNQTQQKKVQVIMIGTQIQ